MGLRPHSQPKFWPLIVIFVLMTLVMTLVGISIVPAQPEKARSVLIFCLGLFLAAGMALLLLWRARELRYLRAIEREDMERQALMLHYQFLTKHISDIILLMDEDWRIISANERAVAAYGYDHARLQRLTLPELHARDRRFDFEANAMRLPEQDGASYETIHHRRDGSTFPVECSLRVITIEGVRFFQAIARDTSERKHAEQELRESDKRFRLFYEQTPISYQALSEAGTLLDVNQAWSDFLGYSREEAIGRAFGDFLSPRSQDDFRAAFQRYQLLGEIRGAEFEMVCRNGAPVYVGVQGKAGFDELGKLTRFHCVLHDITAQKLAEERIRRINEELEQRVIERTTQLQAANKELEAFSYSVSHDLRAPLRAIDGFARILLDEYGAGLDDDARRYLGVIGENTQAMARLIDDLLIFSRLSRQPLKKVPVDPAALVQESLDVLRGDYAERPIRFVVGDLPPCAADPMLLKQVYVNLLSNAIKFSRHRDPAVVEVGSLREDGHVIYFVKDNGVGFDMQYAPKLFGVFQRLHRVEDYEGTGVGLAIVQRIIHRHGGRVWAEGAPDQGATFCFHLSEDQPL